MVIAPHNVRQAARVADRAAFFLMGQLVEHDVREAGDVSARIFTAPRHQRTNEYVTGRFG